METSTTEGLALFTRFPSPGETKTRLIPALGAKDVADLQRRMTLHTLSVSAQYCECGSTALAVWFAGGDADTMRALYGTEFDYIPQSDGTLGDRMAGTFARFFENGYEKVVIIGSDCPELSPDDIERACALLDSHDLVLGPAYDGGYYLIGLRKNAWSTSGSGLFRDMPWGEDAVLDQTLKNAADHGLTHELLGLHHDVDRPEDLHVWDSRRIYVSKESSISVIIPALNESASIAETLSRLNSIGGVEVIVVDGGSTDDTRAIAEINGARVIMSLQGRGCRLNAGAEAASGDLFLFLHADTALPVNFVDIVRRTLKAPDVMCGAFTLRIDSKLKLLRIIEKIANWRSRKMGMPYGDQALFMRRDVFRATGGFPEQPLMEDFEYMRRLRKKGRIVTVPECVLTSGRRWETKGLWRVTMLNQMIILAYLSGISPERLHRWYRGAGRV